MADHLGYQIKAKFRCNRILYISDFRYFFDIFQFLIIFNGVVTYLGLKLGGAIQFKLHILRSY